MKHTGTVCDTMWVAEQDEVRASVANAMIDDCLYTSCI